MPVHVRKAVGKGEIRLCLPHVRGGGASHNLVAVAEGRGVLGRDRDGGNRRVIQINQTCGIGYGLKVTSIRCDEEERCASW